MSPSAATSSASACAPPRWRIAPSISEPFYKDRNLIRARAQAALEQLRKHPQVDPDKVAAIGYCFGGLVVLEMARANMPVNGVVSFHGQFNTPAPAKSIGARVLVLHGAIDPVTPPEEVAGLQKEMEEAKADWQLVLYGGAKHTFTNFNLPTDLARPRRLPGEGRQALLAGDEGFFCGSAGR